MACRCCVDAFGIAHEASHARSICSKGNQVSRAGPAGVNLVCDTAYNAHELIPLPEKIFLVIDGVGTTTTRKHIFSLVCIGQSDQLLYMPATWE